MLLSVLALKFIRKRISWEHFKENHEVGGFLFNALGLIYAVIVAFVMFISWTEYTDAINFSENEISHLRSLYHNSQAFDIDMEREIRERIKSYVNLVIADEWPMLSQGKISDSSRFEFTKLWNTYLNAPHLKDGKTEIVYQESLKDLTEVSNARVMRIATSRKNIPGIVWAVIIIGALTSIGFSLFFGTRVFKVQATMTALFAMTNALIILLIFYLDHPFSGNTGLSPIIFSEFIEMINKNPLL
jgi:hypothetical protein